VLNPLRDKLFFSGGHFCPMHALNLPYPQLCQVCRLHTSHKFPCSLLLHVHNSNQTHPLTNFQYSLLLAVNCSSRLGKSFTGRKQGPTRQKGCFRYLFVHRRGEMAHPVPTKVFLKLSPDSAMIFAPFGCIHISLSHPFCPCGTYLQRTLLKMTSWSWKFHALLWK